MRTWNRRAREVLTRTTRPIRYNFFKTALSPLYIPTPNAPDTQFPPPPKGVFTETAGLSPPAPQFPILVPAPRNGLPTRVMWDRQQEFALGSAGKPCNPFLEIFKV